MKKEYHGYKYEITPSGERYEIRVWTPHADTRAPGISLVGSPRTAEAENGWQRTGSSTTRRAGSREGRDLRPHDGDPAFSTGSSTTLTASTM